MGPIDRCSGDRNHLFGDKTTSQVLPSQRGACKSLCCLISNTEPLVAGFPPLFFSWESQNFVEGTLNVSDTGLVQWCSKALVMSSKDKPSIVEWSQMTVRVSRSLCAKSQFWLSFPQFQLSSELPSDKNDVATLNQRHWIAPEPLLGQAKSIQTLLSGPRRL